MCMVWFFQMFRSTITQWKMQSLETLFVMSYKSQYWDSCKMLSLKEKLVCDQGM